MTFFSTFLLLVVVGIASPAHSSWPMFQHDPQQTGNSTDASLTPSLTQRWLYDAGNLITSSPTIANGAVYIGSSDGKVHAVDAGSGASKWVYDSEMGPTLWSAALVSNENVYIASNGGGTSGVENSYLYILKINPATTNGELIEKVLLSPRGQLIPSSPVLFNDIIYIGSSGTLPEDNKIWAIDAQTFAVVTPYPISVPDGLPVSATPAVTQNSVIVGTFQGNIIHVFDRVSGTFKWSATVNAPYVFPAASTANGIVYVRSGGAGYAGDIIAFAENTGAELWRKSVGRVVGWGSPAIAGGVIYTSSDTNIYAFDAITGQKKWDGPAVAGACDVPSISYSFFAVGNGMIFVKSSNGASGVCPFTNVYAVSTTDGSLVWDSGLLSTAGIGAGGDWSTPAVDEGTVYFGAGKALYAYSKEFLSFPLHVACDGIPCTAFTMPISSVMDHSIKVSKNVLQFYTNQRDSVVVAYTGETGLKKIGYDTLFGYQQDKAGTEFSVNGHYTGGKFLYYDGHPGFDFPMAMGTPIYAPADGILFIPDADPVTFQSDPTGAVTQFNVIVLDHENGYSTWYLHLGNDATGEDFRLVQLPENLERLVTSGERIRVTRGTQIGRVGNKGLGTKQKGKYVPAPASRRHLHFEVRIGLTNFQCAPADCVPVDPYGWTDPNMSDPYPAGKNIRLWE